ncbi:MAG: FitA-like ribbon-helix-helix domain-containing protein [Leucobacter sp.]
MATLTIRDVPERTRQSLKERAARNNRSMEAEIRAILMEITAPDVNFIERWIGRSAELRGEIQLPQRSQARALDLG